MPNILAAKAILESFANPTHATFSAARAQEVLKAFNELFEIQNSHLQAVLTEVTVAKDMWPPFNSAHEGFAVLLEEVDELKKEVWTNQKKRDPEKMYKEAKQVAAMAVRMMGECCSEETCRK